ncbi:MAG: M28 family peptidase [Bacteroidetes bacterium]|nr:MAG: M28 family peptidase [Bacteroidota bacterium]
MFKKLNLTLAICAFTNLLMAQSPASNYANSITKEDLSKHLSILASDEYEGRETGKKGQKMAAEYIIKHYKSLGLAAPVKNSVNPYLQSFDLKETSWGTTSLSSENAKLEFLKDYAAFGQQSVEKMSAEMVFVGFGIDDPAYSDYKNIDVKGKIVVIVGGEPKNEKGIFLITKTTEKSKWTGGKKQKLAMEKGAVAIFQIYSTNEEFTKTLNLYKSYLAAPSLSLMSEKEEKKGIPVIMSSPEGAAKLFGTKSKKIEKAIAKMNSKGETKAGEFLAKKVELSLELKTGKVQTENILAYMEGTDKKDELLVITSHYDHIGIVDGKINNGADDDGSGTVTVMELAEAFTKAKAEGKAPRRSILFMNFTGEEKGLLGSEYYSENPIFPMSNTVTNLNIDMVGRVDDDHKDNANYIYIIGSDMLSTELHKLSEETATKYGEVKLDYKYNSKDDPNRFYYRSDHYNFAKHGVPVIFYFNGTHPDYHQPTDDVEKINFDKMEKIGRLIFHTAWELANKDSKVVVDKKAE